MIMIFSLRCACLFDVAALVSAVTAQWTTLGISAGALNQELEGLLQFVILGWRARASSRLYSLSCGRFLLLSFCHNPRVEKLLELVLDVLGRPREGDIVEVDNCWRDEPSQLYLEALGYARVNECPRSSSTANLNMELRQINHLAQIELRFSQTLRRSVNLLTCPHRHELHFHLNTLLLLVGLPLALVFPLVLCYSILR